MSRGVAREAEYKDRETETNLPVCPVCTLPSSCAMMPVVHVVTMVWWGPDGNP